MGILATGSFPSKFQDTAGPNNLQERTSAQQVREPSFYPRPTNKFGGSQHVVESTYPQPIAMAEVVLLTQLIASIKDRNTCSAIMASIGSDSPVPSKHWTRGEERRNIGHNSHVEAYLINKLSSLMALGSILSLQDMTKFGNLETSRL